MTAKFVKEITVIDPDSQGEVQLAVFKHDNGGMFALDSSYIEQNFDTDSTIFIPDPLNDTPEYSDVELLGV